MHTVVTHEPYNAEVRWHSLRSAITPNEAFFVRCNFAYPDSAPEIEIEGRVWQLEELQKLPRHEVEVTLECAGNGRTLLDPVPEGTPWNLGAVSNAVWAGTPLAGVLKPPPEAVEVIFEGRDGHGDEKGPFARSLPVQRALHPDVLLCWEMNGEPLPWEHGGPLRLLVPGLYGMASVKWLRKVSTATEPFEGHFQSVAYQFHAPGQEKRPVGPIRPRALIVSPVAGAELSGTARLEGWAWSGTGPVVKVELRAGGAVLEAQLGPSRGPYAWRPWHCDLSLPPGHHLVHAWATDAAGNTQPEEADWNHGGYENNPPHEIGLTFI